MSVTVRELLAATDRSFSFEFSSPRTDAGEETLWQAVQELEPLAPTFVSVTYRPSTADRTLRVVERIAAETTLVPVAHLVVAGASRAELAETVRRLADAGIRNVLALRGDPPGGLDQVWEAHPDGLDHAEDLVRLLHEEGDFCVGVAAFPEGHPESADRDTDVKYLAQKCAAGADFATTQFFFEADDYFSLVAAARRLGCDVPIIPGVMPVTNVAQIEKMAALSGTALPQPLVDRLHVVADDPDAVRAVGVAVATDLCQQLLDGGAPGIHLYTLNKSTATREIFERLDTRRR